MSSTATVTRPSISVVICCYTPARWPQTVAACASVLEQLGPQDELLVVVDHCADVQERARRQLSDVQVLSNTGPRGLSGARNEGIAGSRGEVVAFLDDDARASPGWLEQLAHLYDDARVLGVGGHIEPSWQAGRPPWFPPEFDWVVGCSHAGMPGSLAPVRNLIGANMSFRRAALVSVGGFRPDLGRIGTRPVGCEETELCLRVAHDHPDGRLLYQPAARVEHDVPAGRGTWRYFLQRCYSEGISKAAVTRIASAGPALASERAYTRSVLPRALIRSIGHARAASGLAVVAGLSATVTGYLVGLVPAPQSSPPATVRAGWVRTWPWVSAAAALVLWLLSLRSVPLARMTDLGLNSVLPTTYWTALGLVVVSSAVLIHHRRGSPVIVSHLVLLVLVVHATPAILYHTTRYGWAWKHVGIVDYIVRHHAVDPTIGGPFAAYHAWPGFFALNAVLVAGAGLGSALSYAAWAPPAFELAYLAPVFMLARTLTGDRRRAWLTVLLFYLTNWVGQDYFSPQAFAYLLHLVILMICVRYLPGARHHPSRLSWWRRPLAPDAPEVRPVSPAGRRALLGTVMILMLVVVSSHQLTPFMLLSTLVLLVLGRQLAPRWLPWFLAAAILVWGLTVAEKFFTQNLYWIVESIGQPGGNTASTFIDLSHATLEQRVVAYSGRGLSAATLLLAGLGWWRLRRAGQPHRSLALLALAPMLLLAANSYGGEMLFRAYLFALPFLAMLAAGAVYPHGPSRQRGRHRPPRRYAGRRHLGLAIAVVACLTPTFVFAYYGNERANYFSPEEVAASTWLYDHAPTDSLIVTTTAALPWAFTHYNSYQYLFLEDLPAPQRSQLGRRPLQVLDQAVTGHQTATYVILTASGATEARYTGSLPYGSPAVLADALGRDPHARIVFRSTDATVFSLATPEVP